jgi:hypothetical protein
VRYFTRGFANGELSDQEVEAVHRAYAERLRTIETALPDAMKALRDGPSLHDAILERVRWGPSTGNLVIAFVAGTSETGYKTVSLTYRGAMLGAQRVSAVQRIARDRETCVLFQELDAESDSTLVHRLLFWPTEEVTIDYRGLDYAVVPRADARVFLGDAFVLLGDDEGAETE